MKRIPTFVTILFAVISTCTLHAQSDGEYFAPVNWGTQPRNVDWSTNPYSTSYVSIPKTASLLSSGIDITDFTTQEIVDLWHSIGNANLINGEVNGEGTDPFDLNSAGEGTFGAAWKAFYNEDGLYVLFKYIDKINLGGEANFEIALQTKEHTRYEAGWQFASQMDTTGIGYTIMNDQYGRFRELGGMKLYIGRDGILENGTSIGATGAWGTGIGGTSVGDVRWMPGGDGVEWIVVELKFSDLRYYIDEWGPDELSNYASMDPDVENVISFEPQFRISNANGIDYNYWWNGVNDAYKMLYYSGKLEFGSGGFNPVPPPSTPATKIYYCTGETAVPLTATGTDLKWYASIGGDVLPEAPTPSTTTAGTEDYYVTQTLEGTESNPLKIEVLVYDYVVNPADHHVFCGDAAVLLANSNYQGAGTETFDWTTDFGDFTGDNIEIEPLSDGNISLSASTNTGCSASASAELSIMASSVYMEIATVTAEGEANRNIIRWEHKVASEIDSLFILAGADGDETMDTIGRIEYDAGTTAYTDLREPEAQKNNAYYIELKDVCGRIAMNRLGIPSHVRSNLDGAKITGHSNLLQWTPYKGRDAVEYQVLKGESPETLTQVYATSTDFNYYDLSSVTDTLFYRIRTVFGSDYTAPELNQSLSNLIKTELGQGTEVDTLVVYDTIYVTVTDTLYINTSLFGTGEEAMVYTIKVYPNPAKDHIYIETNDFTGEEGYLLKIINTTGSVLGTYDLDQQLYEIDLSEWPGTGLYFIQLINDQGEIRDIRKIILE